MKTQVQPVVMPPDSGTPSPVSRPAGVDEENPWPGWDSFAESEAAFFHGRDAVSERLLLRIRRQPVTILSGPSGMGKTSLLRAGLFPRLRREQCFPVLVRMVYAGDTVPSPLDQIRTTLRSAAQEAGIDSPPFEDGESLWAYFHRTDNSFFDQRRDPVTPVLVFDQFEEAYTLGRSCRSAASTASEFLNELSALVTNDPRSVARGALRPEAFDFQCENYRVVLSLRQDYLASLEPKVFGKALRSHLLLTRMTTGEAEQAVVGAGSRLVAPGVAERIVRVVAAVDRGGGTSGDDYGVEPALLSVFCRELNLIRVAGRAAQISAELVDRAGTGIITDFYKRAVADLDPVGRAFVEDRLLTESGYRNSVSVDDAVDAAGPRTAAKPRLTPAELARLVDRRLVRIDDRLSRPQVELIHDLLVEPVKASRDARHQRQAAAAAAAAARETKRLQDKGRVAIGVILVLLGLSVFAGYSWHRANNESIAASKVWNQTLDTLDKIVLLAQVLEKNSDPKDGRPRQRDLTFRELDRIATAQLVGLEAQFPSSFDIASSTSSRRRLGNLYLRLGAAEHAQRQYLEVLKAIGPGRPSAHELAASNLKPPELAEVHDKLGEIYIGLGDLKRAEQEFARCRELLEDWCSANLGDADAHDALAVAHDKLGDTAWKTSTRTNDRQEEAIRHYTAGLPDERTMKWLDRNDGGARFNVVLRCWKLGRLEWDMGRFDRALTAFRNGLEHINALRPPTADDEQEQAHIKERNQRFRVDFTWYVDNLSNRLTTQPVAPPK